MISPATMFALIAPISAVLALGLAFFFYTQMKQEDEGSAMMIKIAAAVRAGARAYLAQQYKVVFIIFAMTFALLCFISYYLKVQGPYVPFAFITGGFFSGLAGFIGMKTATYASARTAQKCRQSLNQGLQIAFRSGAVMGLTVVSLVLLDITAWFVILKYVFRVESLGEITTSMLTFGMGASLQALFARVGGGIFTKAADVGADLVGKVEVGIPEDDYRNPATIADNVGDNVGDIAGMGADLYDSYACSILATMAIGAAAGFSIEGVLVPMVIAGVGVLCSIVGIFTVRTGESVTQKNLLRSVGMGVNVASVLIGIASFFVIRYYLPEHTGVFWAILVGLIAGVLIGFFTEYYTSEIYSPTRRIAHESKTGVATLIISGMAVGMEATVAPVVIVVFGTLFAYYLAGGLTTPILGLYGVSIAAVGMLSSLGITLATDAYGPIADNAGGIAQMAGLEPVVRERTDALDSLGNTTAAIGKGFSIGSAALTAMALLASYFEEVRYGLLRAGMTTIEVMGRPIDVMHAEFIDFVNYYGVHLMNPKVLAGLFLGSMISFAFCALTIKAVGTAASLVVMEVRRQFKEIVGLMEGKVDADYAKTVEICTRGAQREMVFPSMAAFMLPIVVGFLLGVPAVMGLLIGVLVTGFCLAIMMAASGGAWDNAKKYIESGQFGGGKGSEYHKAAVVGDTLGDPFKDTAGPSISILIKLLAMVSVVFAGVTVKYGMIVSAYLGMG